MSRKTWFISAGCFILGLLLGIGGAMAYFGKAGAEALFLVKAGELAEASEHADDVYQHGSEPVAIYALSQYLAKLKQAEELGPTPFTDKLDISFGMAMAHGRLARLYDATGRTNMSAQEVVKALKCARDSGKLLWVTNQTMLAKFVARGGARKETQ